MRYDSARAAGLNEATIANVDTGYQAHFNGAEAAALALTDCLLEMPYQPSEAEQQALEAMTTLHASAPEVFARQLELGLENLAANQAEAAVAEGTLTPSSAVEQLLGLWRQAI